MATEEELLVRTASGDQAALAELYRRMAPRVLALATRILGSREEAEEVLQDTFVKLYRDGHRYTPEKSSARTFVLTVARNLAISRLRARSARPTKAPLDVHDPGFSHPAPEPPDLTTRVVVRRALEQLEADERRLLEEAFFMGYTHKELAQRHGLPLGTVKTRLRRALLKLRRYLEAP
ncbi:RNA polymerase sigma factor [Marinithermus hydrothermalis]|uniref:RNA polymerase, sigma-24 subunit, ECF subfamily n=1 Tax=Marinithermus hydrothermalis (strain DSM 14884 / JCM 11576 / T1) TaxID=869210 RepID=F2NMC5_MARHT|nr:sigma-70 family RNA polymerase sigma factor [Marinithermus hydrothermalis]AEB11813.1 RNA polymerase, sigma-24 subunit, ECF subfamily [Marinithermus hydrothermalis DSM 14884]